MTRNPDRPLSPHLGIWRWGWSMTVSILHRITGGALSVAGLALLTWWLAALARGGEAYAAFAAATNHWFGIVVLVGLTWAFWQHMLSGIRHLVLDAGAGFEARTNRFFSVLVLVGALFLTTLTWAAFEGVFA